VVDILDCAAAETVSSAVIRWFVSLLLCNCGDPSTTFLDTIHFSWALESVAETYRFVFDEIEPDATYPQGTVDRRMYDYGHRRNQER